MSLDIWNVPPHIPRDDWFTVAAFTIGIGHGDWSADKIEEVKLRTKFLRRLHPSWIPSYVTDEWLDKAVGLKTNVFVEPRKKWEARMVEAVWQDIAEEHSK